MLTSSKFEQYKKRFGPELTMEEAEDLLRADHVGGRESYYVEQAIIRGIDYRRKLCKFEGGCGWNKMEDSNFCLHHIPLLEKTTDLADGQWVRLKESDNPMFFEDILGQKIIAHRPVTRSMTRRVL